MSIPNEPYWLRFTPKFVRQRLDGHETLHRIINNTGWLMGDQALRMGLGLLVGAWVARYLGPSQYGELSYVLAFVAFFQAISMLGLNGIVIRDMAKDREASPLILGTVYRLRLFASVLSWICAVGTMAAFRPGDTKTLILTAIIAGTLVFQANDTIDLWFQSQTQSKRTVVAKIFAYVINSIVKVGLILFHAPLIYFAISSLIEFVLGAMALSISYRLYPAPFRWKWDIGWGKRLIKEAWPYLLSSLAIIIYMRIDQIMIREMLGTHELGIFSAAMPLSTTWYFIPVLISQSVGPSIAKKKDVDQSGYDQSIDRLFSMMWWIMLPISVSIALLSNSIVRFLYGESYMASANVLAVHVFANIPVALGVMQAIWIVNERKNTLSLIKTVSGAVANIGLNFILIPKFGAIGAASATVISYGVSAVFSNIVFAPNIFKRQIISLIHFN
jgi:PST family polysaccharide transporter